MFLEVGVPVETVFVEPEQPAGLRNVESAAAFNRELEQFLAELELAARNGGEKPYQNHPDWER